MDDVPDYFAGAAIIHVTGGEGGVTAVSNNVNYAVQCDGSAAFNLVKTGWAGFLVLEE